MIIPPAHSCQGGNAAMKSKSDNADRNDRQEKLSRVLSTAPSGHSDGTVFRYSAYKIVNKALV